MYYIFILIYCISLAYVIIKKRRIDLYTVSFAGLFYYSLPLVFGEITLPGVVYGQPINSTIYGLFSLAFLLNLFSIVKTDSRNKEFRFRQLRQPSVEISKKKMLLISIVVLGIFAYGVFDFGLSNYIELSKGSNVENSAVLEFSIVLSMILLPVNVYFRYIKGIIIYFLILFSFFVFGVRSYFVIAILASAFIYFGFKEIRLVKKAHLLALASFFGISMAIYKLIFRIVKVSDASTIVRAIRNLDHEDVIAHLLGDPMAVIYNLNYTLNYDLTLPSSYILHRFFSILPGGGGLLSKLTGEKYVRFSYFLNQENYTDIHWGLASSFYAELIAISGYIGFVIALIFINKVVFDYNMSLIKQKIKLERLIFLSAFIYVLFYAHRVDITFVLGVFKVSFLLFLILKSLVVTEKK